MVQSRLLRVVLLALIAGGCGGRTGLGVWIDGGGPEEDASVPPDAEITDAVSDAVGDGRRSDGAVQQDAATGNNCGEIMMCAFESLSSGFNLQALLACTQGSSVAGLAEGGALIMCMVQNCASMLIGDGGGQFGIFMCLVQSCTTQICACEGIGDIIPPGIITCS
jgi:hypothetical protein